MQHQFPAGQNAFFVANPEMGYGSDIFATSTSSLGTSIPVVIGGGRNVQEGNRLNTIEVPQRKPAKPVVAPELLKKSQTYTASSLRA
jgi:hypothetical protein